MKKTVQTFFAILAAVMLSVSSVCAEAGDISAHDNEITVSGESAPDTYMFYTVFKPDFDVSSLNEETAGEMTAAAGQVLSDENGTYNFEFKLNSSMPSGIYTIRLTPAGSHTPEWKTFSYLSVSQIPEVVTMFNGADAEDMQKLTEQYLEFIDTNGNVSFESIKNVSDVYKKMEYIKNKTPFESLADIALALEQSIFMTKFYEASDIAAAEAILKEDGSAVGIDFSVFDMLDSVSEIVGELKRSDFLSADDFLEGFDTFTAIYAFSTLSRNDMEFLISAYEQYLVIPSKYDSLPESAKKNLYKSLEAESGFKDFDDISDFIDDFTDSYFDDKNSGGSPSGPSGGGSKSSGKVTVVPDVSAPDAPSETSPVVEPYFSDISGVEWAQEAIIYLAGRNVLGGIGDGLFAPDRNVTREEFVKMIVIAFDIPASEMSIGFADVSESAWYYEYVCAAAGNGIVNGESDEYFGTGKYITREDMAVMLYRTAQYKALELAEVKVRDEFSDAAMISGYAADAVELLYQNNIINGVGEGNFAPKDFSTRAMAAKLIYELSNIYLKK